MLKRLLIILIFTGTSLYSQTPDFYINGKVLDSISNAPLANATVQLIHLKSSSKHHDLSDKSGKFEIKSLLPGTYSIKVTFVGFTDYQKEIKINKNSDSDIGKILLQPTDVLLNQVNVTGKAPIVEFKEDTAVYNATSYKVQSDAVAEDLIKKMPGITVESDGTVKAQGEQVKKVLVDGKEFFGTDPTAALRNLPADNIEKIQVFDKFSDNSDFTGFDDGLSEKAINIITKANRRNGQFAKFNGGAGLGQSSLDNNNDYKYSTNFNANFYKENQRISILGMSNNINQQNFSFSDILGALNSSNDRASQTSIMIDKSGGLPQGFRPPGGGRGMFGGGGSAGFSASDFMVNQTSGISTVHSAGLNYIDLIGEDLEISGSYFFNYAENTDSSNYDRIYYDSLNLEDINKLSFSKSDSKNINHRANLVFKYIPNKTNQFSFRPNITFQSNIKSAIDTSYTDFIQLIDTIANKNKSYTIQDGINFSSELLYRHAFDLKGRTITLGLNNSTNNKYGYIDQYGLTYRNPVSTIGIIDSSITNPPQDGYSYSLSGTYTEPLGNQALFSLTHSSSKSNSKYTEDVEGIYNNLILNKIYNLDTVYSYNYEYTYWRHSPGIGLKYKFSDFNITASLNYQMSVLPETITKNNIYTSLLPSFVISYKLSQKSNLRLNYRTSTQVPSGYQLLENLDKIDNTSFYQGRNDLNEQYTHSIFGRFQNVGSDFSKMFMWNFHLMSRSNFLANNTIYLQQDTIIDEHRFAKGNTFSRPINLNGYLDGRTYIVYGFPLFELPINCNFNFGLGYTKTPGIYNGISYLSENYSGNSMLVLTSNISSDLDFTLTGGITSNYTKMNTTSVSNSRYNTFFGNINFNWIFWEGFFIGGNVREMFYTGLKGDAKTNYSLVNLNIGKKLFNNAAEIKLSVYDAFDQNKSIQTNVTDYYREDVYSNVLRRYALLTFTLNYKNFYSKN